MFDREREDFLQSEGVGRFPGDPQLVRGDDLTRQPFLEEFLGFTRASARQEIFDADVFIDVFPMDTMASANQIPVVPFLLCGVLNGETRSVAPIWYAHHSAQHS